MKRNFAIFAFVALVGGQFGCSRFTPIGYPPSAGTPSPVADNVSEKLILIAAGQPDKAKSDSPLFGGSPSRNMVNLIDKNVPTEWNVEEKKEKNIKWIAQLGTRSYGGPVIANGIVLVGTNAKGMNKGEKAVLVAYSEATGKQLWKLTHDFPGLALFNEALGEGLCSTPVVDGEHIYYVLPGCEVVCADLKGKVHWKYDMMKELKIVPFHLGNCSPVVVGDLVMVITANGRDDEGHIPSPKSPSFIAINKKTGKIVWQSNLPGDKIIEGQWSNPTVATVDGKTQVIFAGGDAVLYSFEPETGKLIWQCSCNPVRGKGKRETENYMISTPVVVGDRLYVGMGVYPDHPQSPRSAHVVCIDITKKGDVSPKSLDAKDPANKGSALVWAFGGMIDPSPAKGRQAYMGPTISTPCVHDGLVYIPELAGYLHCLDAKSGQRYWEHDFKATTWGSAYYVDGKVYVGNEDGDVVIFAHGKTKKIIATHNMDDGIHGTPVVANGVLYIITKTKLYAIK